MSGHHIIVIEGALGSISRRCIGYIGSIHKPARVVRSFSVVERQSAAVRFTSYYAADRALESLEDRFGIQGRVEEVEAL